jgi:hypothetical protein
LFSGLTGCSVHGGDSTVATNYFIKISEMKKARSVFEANEPRNLFYRAATELVRLAVDKETSLSVVDALAVLLQTWNRAYYRYRKFDARHFEEINSLYRKHRRMLNSYANRTIENLRDDEMALVCSLFLEFEEVLGPVGAAKVLHLLAPMFFPLWDRKIAQAHGKALGKVGTNNARYWQFMLITRGQCFVFKEKNLKNFTSGNMLKWIDECNYCKFTTLWI